MNYLLYGTESFRLKKKLEEILTANDPQRSSLNCFFYDGSAADFRIQDVLEDAWTIPFFAEKKTLVIRNPQFLYSTGSLKEKDSAALEAYLKQSCPSTDLIFYAQAESVDQRKKLVKLIIKTCRVFNMKKMDEREFRAYVIQTLKEHHLQLDPDALSELLSRLSDDMESFHHELEKLELFGSRIHREDVVHLVSRPLDEDVFHLVNAVAAQNLKQALHLWADLSVLNKDPIYLVALLASQFRLMNQVSMLADHRMTEREIAAQLKVHPFRVKKALEARASLSSQRLLSILNDLAVLDQNFKNGITDRKLGFELFLIKAAK